MNYNDKILESKIFNIFKQLIKNIAIAVCIILGSFLILVYIFGFRPYEVETNSMYPIFVENDMVVVKAQKDYKVGDIITFNQSGLYDKVTHRIVHVLEENNGNKIYVCHGDAVDYTVYDNLGNKDIIDRNNYSWQEYAEHLSTLTNEQINNIGITVQSVAESQVEGKVVMHMDKWGAYVNEIARHKFLLIGIIIGVWCVTETIQNELDMKRALRLI